MIGILQANLDDVLGNGAHVIIGRGRSCIFGAHGRSLMAVMVPNLEYHGGAPSCQNALANVMLATKRVCLQTGPQLEAKTVHKSRSLQRIKNSTKMNTGRQWPGWKPIGRKP